MTSHYVLKVDQNLQEVLLHAIKLMLRAAVDSLR